MIDKTHRFILEPQIHKEFIYHDMTRAKEEIGLGYRYIDNSMFPEADICVGVQEIRQVPPDFRPFIESHKHEVNQFYGIIGALAIEVTLDDKKYEVNAPASVFIPAGLKHTFCPIGGSGYVMVVLRSGTYK